MTAAPCKGCEKRYAGCHSECERYAEYSRERAEMLKARKSEREYEEAHSRQAVNALWRKRKRERRR